LRERGERPAVCERLPEMVRGFGEVVRERTVALLELPHDTNHQVAVPRVQLLESPGGMPRVVGCEVAHEVLDLALQAKLGDEADGRGVLQPDTQGGDVERAAISAGTRRPAKHEAERQRREYREAVGGNQPAGDSRRGAHDGLPEQAPCQGFGAVFGAREHRAVTSESPRTHPGVTWR